MKTIEAADLKFKRVFSNNETKIKMTMADLEISYNAKFEGNIETADIKIGDDTRVKFRGDYNGGQIIKLLSVYGRAALHDDGFPIIVHPHIFVKWEVTRAGLSLAIGEKTGRNMVILSTLAPLVKAHEKTFQYYGLTEFYL